MSLFIIFVFYPLVDTFFLSFYKWSGATVTKDFVGLLNYGKLIHDKIFWIAFLHNVIWTVLSIVVVVSIALVLAVLLSGKTKGRELLTVVYYLPAMIAPVAVGIMWSLMYHPQIGILNMSLKLVGLGFLARPWLGLSGWSLVALILASGWTYHGFCTILFLAGLQNIDPQLYDAAKIDGANNLQQFFHITIPSLRNVITLVLIWTIIGSFRAFDIVWSMTRGSPHHATEVLSTWLYQKGFQASEVGYAATMSVVLTAIVLTCTIFYVSYTERGKYA